MPYGGAVPPTVASIFAAAGLRPTGVVRWRERIPLVDPCANPVALTAEVV